MISFTLRVNRSAAEETCLSFSFAAANPALAHHQHVSVPRLDEDGCFISVVDGGKAGAAVRGIVSDREVIG
jgi:hypothetical protein